MKRNLMWIVVLQAILLVTGAAAQAGVERGVIQTQVPTPPAVQMPQVPEGAAPQGQQAAPSQSGQAQEEVPPPSEQQQMPAETTVPLRVRVGKSILINTTDRLKRVSSTDSTIADAVVVSPTQLIIHGRAPGEVSLIIWDVQDRSRSFDLRVDVDVTAATDEMKTIFPDQNIKVSASRNAIVLSGHVLTDKDAERAGLVASAYSKNVINVLTFGPVGQEQIMLEVKFAELDRTRLTQLGLNLFSTGAGNTFGAVSTQQFGGFSGSTVGAVTSDVQVKGTPPGNNLITSEINNQLFHQPGIFGTNDLLNLFLFRTDANIGAIVRLLRQSNVLQILAEPNVIAANGKEASFLAGGEFPYPVSQGISGAVTIQFKEFGVRLKFVPLIRPNGDIHLQVAPEVSTLDFSNALTISGFLIPALSTRRATTELDLKDGQSFAIAGLMDNRVSNIASKVPGLGDIPILGTFFKSKNLQKNRTELMVLVTARRVTPSTGAPTLPKYPYPFMDQKDMKDETTKPAPPSGQAAPQAGQAGQQ